MTGLPPGGSVTVPPSGPVPQDLVALPRLPAGRAPWWPLDDAVLHVVRSMDGLDECRRWASQRRDTPLAYDTESEGLSPYRHRLRRVQLGDTVHGWSFWPGWEGAATEILQSYDRGLVAASAPYDNRVLARNAGFRPRWECTGDVYVLGRLADSVAKAGLKERASAEVDPRAGYADTVLADARRRQHWDWATVPDGYWPYDCYAALDTVLTARLWACPAFRAAEARYRDAYDLELATGRVCAAMMDAGMMIDVPFIEEAIDRIEDYLRGSLTALRAAGVTSVHSSAAVGAALQQAGVVLTEFTPTGQPECTKDVLRTYAAMYPGHAALIWAILWRRKGTKVINSYLRKFLELRTGDDIVHYTINPCRALTHRQSVTDPAMQTFDREEAAVRGAWVPRPDHVFLTVDADQIEARLAAHFSGDRAMISEFRRCDQLGLSFFVETASQIYRGPVSKKDPRYTTTKNATYAQIYGSGLRTAARTAGVPEAQMRLPYEGFRALYPGVQALMDRTVAEARAMPRPAVQALDGRWLYCEPGKEYKLQDYRIQGSAAVILKRGLVMLDAAGWGPCMRLPVHDEILLEVPAAHAREALDDVLRILTDRDSFAVPITWNGSVLEKRWEKR